MNTASDNPVFAEGAGTDWPPTADGVRAYLLDLRDRICAMLRGEDADAVLQQDPWIRPQGGGGEARVFTGGPVLEQAGVNFSEVSGDSLPNSASATRPELSGRGFHAMGVSVVVHPRNPLAPTTHMNVRLIQAIKPGMDTLWWFGGGFDLTPHYPFNEDILAWHKAARAACAEFGDNHYARYKQACDRYFHLPHRGETRGIGGLFFDDYREGGFERAFAFMRSVGNAFVPTYQSILAARKHMAHTEAQRQFQLWRRGRYVEFNLLYDRGTLFGLQSKGRTESILMSLPPLVSWHYGRDMTTCESGIRLAHYLKPRDWLNGDLP